MRPASSHLQAARTAPTGETVNFCEEKSRGAGRYRFSFLGARHMAGKGEPRSRDARCVRGRRMKSSDLELDLRRDEACISNLSGASVVSAQGFRSRQHRTFDYREERAAWCLRSADDSGGIVGRWAGG